MTSLLLRRPPLLLRAPILLLSLLWNSPFPGLGESCPSVFSPVTICTGEVTFDSQVRKLPTQFSFEKGKLLHLTKSSELVNLAAEWCEQGPEFCLSLFYWPWFHSVQLLPSCQIAAAVLQTPAGPQCPGSEGDLLFLSLLCLWTVCFEVVVNSHAIII